ncbi:MAG: transcriptional repressor LexA [Gemmatales bacterium]|nr:transcriptional repressor LexA [Gemmatales bacterium]MDW8175783.1 transcriptional repressor LexA [Gemmatales bacterium]
MLEAQLTPRQREIYRFIRQYAQEHGYVPTVREIARHFGIRSPNGAVCHLRALERKGLLERQRGQARAMVLRHEPWHYSLPIYGVVAAGSPVEALQQEERLQLDELFPKHHGLFALRVRGNSMIEDHIQDGDLVLIEPKSNPCEGEPVVAWINGEVTLKRFYRESGGIRLQPANSDMKPIYVSPKDNVRILGVLRGVIRSYR